MEFPAAGSRHMGASRKKTWDYEKHLQHATIRSTMFMGVYGELTVASEIIMLFAGLGSCRMVPIDCAHCGSRVRGMGAREACCRA